MSRKIAIAVTITTILTLALGFSVHLAENELTPCDFVQRFKIANRPSKIEEEDLPLLSVLPNITESDIGALENTVPINTKAKLINTIGKDKAFLLRIFYNLTGDETCETVPDHIVINEFDPSPAEGEEYVELYNPTDQEINIEGWILESFGRASEIFKEKTTIKARGYYVIELGKGKLRDQQEVITLRNDSGNVIDNTQKVDTPSHLIFSWQRCYNGKDTDSINDWHFKQPTPEANNECQ